MVSRLGVVGSIHASPPPPNLTRVTTLCRYFPGDLSPAGDVRANTHNKLLLMAPSYDRHGTVGFRCVADAPGTPSNGHVPVQ